MCILALAAACGSEQAEPAPVPATPDVPEPETPAQWPMLFSAVDGDRAGSRDEAMELRHQTFRIWTTKHTSTNDETVMPGYIVEYQDTYDWQYDGTKYTTPYTYIGSQYCKYWDASATGYDFLAYAPVHFDGLTPIDDLDIAITDGAVKIKDLTGNTNEMADYIVAHHRRNPARLIDTDVFDTDYTFLPALSAIYDVVPLRFHYLYSQVEFLVYNAGQVSAQVSEFYVRFNDTDKIYTKGSYTSSGWTDLENETQTIVSTNYGTSPIVVPDHGDYTQAQPLYVIGGVGQVLYEIPQALPDEIHFFLNINGALTEGVSQLGGSWEAGKKYIYVIRLDVGTDNDPILVDIAPYIFEYGDEYSFTQTNW